MKIIHFEPHRPYKTCHTKIVDSETTTKENIMITIKEALEQAKKINAQHITNSAIPRDIFGNILDNYSVINPEQQLVASILLENSTLTLEAL
jgi:hypothetical protein